jgi:cell division protein FtsB
MGQRDRGQANGNRREGSVPAPPRRRSIAMLVLLLFALVLIIDAVAGERGWLANRRAAAQYRAAQQALDEARARNAALRDEVQRLRRPDPGAIEEAARRQLGLMKPGEKLFIVRDQVQPDRAR